MENYKIENISEFNPEISKILHLDLNSCFASIEQQANPLLRGKPIAVAAFNTPRGCILAPSIEAKKLGIKTGMRVGDAQKIYPSLKVLTPDPWKYRNIHLKLRRLVSEYTNDFSPKSIDEFVLNLGDYLAIHRATSCVSVAREIKKRIKDEIGDWLTVSVGIAPNRYLAKVAAGLHKPDGLDEINKNNFLDIYSKLRLTDLTGIKERNALRLNIAGIYSVLDFYNASPWKLKQAFGSVTGIYWHFRLSGFEVDDFKSNRGSFGNSVAIGKNIWRKEDLSPILSRLTEKMCFRLRNAGYEAAGVHLALYFKNGAFWHKGKSLPKSSFDTRDFYRAFFELLSEANPGSPVLNISVSVFNLTKIQTLQLGFFEDEIKRQKLIMVQDSVNRRWGNFTVGSARSFGGAKMVLDRISFGGVGELVSDAGVL